MNFKAVLITAWIWFPALATAYETKSESYLVCKSPECTERAKLLNESLNITIDPCTDFYSYVCGKWESAHPLPSGRGSYDVYQEIGEDIPQKMSYILGNRTVVERNQSIIDKVAIMYKACLALPDTSDTLVRVLKASGFNAWPILTEGNIFNSSNCTDLLRHMSISAIGHVELSGEPYKRSTKPKQIFIKHIPLQEIIKKKVPMKVTAIIKNTIKFLKPGIDNSIVENLTKELVEFSNQLSAMIDGSFSRPYKISSLQAEFPNIPMSDLLEKQFGKVNITLYDTDELNVYVTYYQDLNRFLATAKPKTLYNYAGFLAVFPYIEYVNMTNQEATMRGRNWSECIALLDESARDILDYLYVTNDTNHAAIKKEVRDIARRLIEAFNETLQNSSWINSTTRKAFEKELEVPLGIGYPDALLNMSALEAIYKYVPYFPSNISFTEAFYYFQENLYKMTLRKFRHPEESNWRWVHSQREGRSKFHEKFWYDIEIPHPIFVSPIFQRGLPRSLNYGGIGGTIARELGSTFSVDGMQVMPRRHRELTGRWDKLFESRASCLTQRYTAANNETLREHDPNSKVPKPWAGTDQALADNTGLQTAFKAYAKVLEDECANVDTRLTSLENITGMQLFFISNAMTQCRIVDKDTLIKEIKGSDTPARNRVNEAMKNLEAFAKAFNCSLGSPMHPKNTCSFW